MTVREAQDALDASERLPGALATPESLAALAEVRWREASPYSRIRLPWSRDAAWLAAMRAVLHVCGLAAWDPTLFVIAQLDTVGWAMAQRRMTINPGMFISEPAVDRFERWRRRRQRGARVDQVVGGISPEATASATLAAAASEFAQAYLGGWRYSEAVSRGREILPGFDPEQLTPAEAMRALAAGLSALDPVLPRRCLAPEPGWSWREVRRVARLICAPSVDDGVPADDFDRDDIADLGELA